MQGFMPFGYYENMWSQWWEEFGKVLSRTVT